METKILRGSGGEDRRENDNNVSFVPPADAFPTWTERCTHLNANTPVKWVGRNAAAVPDEGYSLAERKDSRPRMTWLLDNGSTAHVADLHTLLPYCFNVREESTVVRSMQGKEVSVASKRADCYLNVRAADGKGAGILFRDIVLVPRSKADVEACTVRKCPRAYPAAGRPVFIAAQYRLQEEGLEFAFAGAQATATLEGRLIRLYVDGRLTYLTNVTPGGSQQSTDDRRDVGVPAYHADLWHWRTHASGPVLSLTAVSSTGIKIQPRSQVTKCPHCLAANMLTWKNDALEIVDNTVRGPLDEIVIDYSGPFKILGLRGGETGVAFCYDKYSRFKGAYPVKQKSDMFTSFVSFVAGCRRLKASFTGEGFSVTLTVRVVSGDQGGENVSKEFQNHFLQHGVTQKLSATGDKTETAALDRAIRTTMDRVRVMLVMCFGPLNLWAVCVIYAGYVDNRLASKRTGMTPFQLLTGRMPDLRHLRIFGCDVLYVETQSGAVRRVGGKLSRKGYPGVFCGISSRIRGYVIWSMERRDFVHVKRCVTNEHSFLNAQQMAGYTLTRINPEVILVDDEEESTMEELLSGLPVVRKKLLPTRSLMPPDEPIDRETVTVVPVEEVPQRIEDRRTPVPVEVRVPEAEALREAMSEATLAKPAEPLTALPAPATDVRVVKPTVDVADAALPAPVPLLPTAAADRREALAKIGKLPYTEKGSDVASQRYGNVYADESTGEERSHRTRGAVKAKGDMSGVSERIHALVDEYLYGKCANAGALAAGLDAIAPAGKVTGTLRRRLHRSETRRSDETLFTSESVVHLSFEPLRETTELDVWDLYADADVDEPRRESLFRVDVGLDGVLGERTPGSIAEAWKLDEGKATAYWREATDKEIAKQAEYETLEYVRLRTVAEDAAIVPGVWEFKIKRNPDGSIARRKARWCVDGSKTVNGVHYDDTFSPTVRAVSVRALWHKALELGVRPRTTDVESAFLNAHLDTLVYVYCPEGYERFDEDGVPMVARVRKALYGMPQAPRCWHNEVAKRLLAHGFKRSEADPCVFVYDKGSDYMALGLHVDDFLRVGSSDAMHAWLHDTVLKGYTCKDEGEADIFVGIQADWLDDHTVLLHQERYVRDLVKRFEDFLPTRAYKTPMEPNFKVSEEELADLCPPEHVQVYQMIVGGLIYPANLTAPALTQPVTWLSRFMSAPCRKMFKAAVRVLRWLQQNPRTGFQLSRHREPKKDPLLVAWADAAFANQPKSRSTMGQVFTTAYGLLSWRCKTVPGVPLSSTEAEIISLVFTVRELVFLRELFTDLGFKIKGPTRLFEDSTATMQVASQVGVSDRTKHMEIKYHFLRHKLEAELFKLEHANTERMVADMFTKALSGPLLAKHLRSITRTAYDKTMATVDDEPEALETAEDQHRIDAGVNKRINEIYKANDWRKMKALRQKRSQMEMKTRPQRQ